MPRPIWSGSISFGLVSIPVKMFNAVQRKSVSFNQLDDRDQSRIKYKKVSASTGEEVPDDHIVKGYEITRGQYVIVDPDDLEQFMPTATRTIDLAEFVELDEIDPIYFDSSYYLAPDKVAKPYSLLAQAMGESGKVGVGRFVMRNKQYAAVVRSVEGRLVLSTMVYPDELVTPTAIDEFEEVARVELSDKELKMAEQLVDSMSGKFNPDEFHDEYREQVLDLIEKKAAGEELAVPEAAPTAPAVVDLMAALEASVKAAKASRGRHPTAKGSAADDEDAAPAEAPARKRAAGARKRKSA